MLHRDITTDEVSLIITHNIDHTTSGIHTGAGAVFFDFEGIPTGAYVSATDDPMHHWTSCPLGTQTHGSPYNEFDLSYDREGEWYYGDNTDGGSLSGLPTTSSWAITITPEGFYNINSWVYHYATGDSIDLDMNEPITISYDAQSSPTTVETDEGTPITIGAFARDWGSDDTPLNYQFTWDDPNDPGAISSGTTLWETLFTATHTYYDNGVFNPVLTVTDSDGATDTLEFTVIVNNVVPDVDAGKSKVIDEGDPLSFSGTFTDPGAYDTHSATWTWGDGQSSAGLVTEENIPPDATGTVLGVHTYMDDGIFTVTLTVGDDDGGLGYDTLTVTVNDLGPTAGFVWSPEPQDEGSPVSFTDLSTSFPDSIVAWSWDFGGLGTSTMQNPSFTFMDDGTYSVTLTVTDDDGSTDSESHEVTISDLAPIPDFSWSPEEQDEGSPVSFTDLSFSYPDVIVSWAWTFGDGGTSLLPSPSHTYGDNGFYTVTLTVTDDDGSVSSISYVVTINNVPPDVDAGPDQTTYEGTMIFFSGSFTDPGWLDTHTILWDFGDGGTASGKLNTSHAYGDNGIYTVTLTVTDDDGGVGSDTLIVEVFNVPPQVTAGNNKTIDEGDTVSIVATFTDPGWLDTHTAIIDWGDGSVEPGTVTETNGSGVVSGSHVYGDNGVYKVIITVTDDDGDSDSDSLFVTVNNLAPTIVSFGPFEIDEGTPLTFTADATDPGSDDLTVTWVLDFGPTLVNIHYNDGTSPDPPQSPWGTFPFFVTDSISQSYGDNGNYSVSLTVEDDDGGIVTLTTYVLVKNVAPSVSIIGGETTVNENSAITFNGRGIDLGSDDLIFTWEFEYGPTFTTIYYNDGSSPDPYPSPDDNPMDIIDSATHTYGDNGIFLLTLTVEDDDGGVTVVKTNITVNNVAPEIVNIEAYMYVNFTLRVAGEKWHSVGVLLYEEDSEIWAATVTRYPGDPDEQVATIEGVKVDMTKSYTALVDYLPNDPDVNGNVWGGNPVWIIMDFEDGSEERLHHTFNVRQSDWDSDHWNHIDPWEVDFSPRLGRHNITFDATATDPGSDDLTFFWDFDDGSTSGPRTYFNDGIAADPYPSPEIKPAEFSESLLHRFILSGTYTITLTVTDDDGGVGVTTLTLVISL
jgi:PKD repeat protein